MSRSSVVLAKPRGDGQRRRGGERARRCSARPCTGPASSDRSAGCCRVTARDSERHADEDLIVAVRRAAERPEEERAVPVDMQVKLHGRWRRIDRRRGIDRRHSRVDRHRGVDRSGRRIIGGDAGVVRRRPGTSCRSRRRSDRCCRPARRRSPLTRRSDDRAVAKIRRITTGHEDEGGRDARLEIPMTD